MKTLTVFTPTYNRKHTLPRTFESLCRQTCDDFEWLIIDDGSSDGTREWVESLGERLEVIGERLEDCEFKSFDWMGRVLHENQNENRNDDYFKIIVDRSLTSHLSPLTITYIYKPNGGLYTGYNVAYQTIMTELCVCIDSDDFMPDDAVEKIISVWSNLSEGDKQRLCGIEGLDFDINTNQPIGGYFPQDLHEVYLHDLHLKKLHSGDTKQVLRTELMRRVAPMIGFEGEKNFNPVYMLLQVCDKYPMIVMNENLCTVEYQIGADSMSQGIFKQYVNSPRSFAKMRLQEMTLVHNTWKDRFRSAVHYVSSCIIAKDGKWLKNSTNIGLTILAAPFGVLMCCLIKYKTRK